MLHLPHNLSIDPSYAPFLALSESVLLTTEEVAKHWRLSKQHVHNMRRLGTGPSWLKLASGSVRYRHSEVLAWELYGHGGGLTLPRISAALATMPGLKPADREKIEAHLNSVLSVKG